jgi:hypothetical protein
MAAGDLHSARRLPVPDSGDINEVFPLEPGDYCGPIDGYSGGNPAVFFRLPASSDEDLVGGVRHVCSPPHVFTEMPDGSLQIRESILTHERGRDGKPWHGYLDAGNVWREV